jgi:hypothetical protein
VAAGRGTLTWHRSVEFKGMMSRSEEDHNELDAESEATAFLLRVLYIRFQLGRVSVKPDVVRDPDDHPGMILCGKVVVDRSTLVAHPIGRCIQQL